MTIEEAGEDEIITDKVQSNQGQALFLPPLLQSKPVSIPIAVIQLPDDDKPISRAKVSIGEMPLFDTLYRLLKFWKLLKWMNLNQ